VVRVVLCCEAVSQCRRYGARNARCFILCVWRMYDVCAHAAAVRSRKGMFASSEAAESRTMVCRKQQVFMRQRQRGRVSAEARGVRHKMAAACAGEARVTPLMRA